MLADFMEVDELFPPLSRPSEATSNFRFSKTKVPERISTCQDIQKHPNLKA